MSTSSFITFTFILSSLSCNFSNSEDCSTARAQALQDISSEKYAIYVFALPNAYTATYHHVLKQQGIQVIGGGDIVTRFGQCYNQTMVRSIKNLYGEEIFDQLEARADSIHKTGKFNREATFPGGHKALMSYIEQQLSVNHLDFPKLPKVHIHFIIQEDGLLTDIEIIRPITDCESCNVKALQVVEDMPTWLFRIENGKAVKSSMNLAIPFKR